MVKSYEHLTAEQVEHFLERGFVKIPNAFTKEQAEEMTADLWVRLGFDPDDKSTWTSERLHLPRLRPRKVKEFSPKAFILNFGTPETEGKIVPPEELDNWHCDGDFFLHFLDSPEQALLITPIFSKILPNGGGTYIAPRSIASVAQLLASHPEGLLPGLGEGDQKFDFMARLKECEGDFVELTGDVGDVILMHPLMLHSASKNALRIPRIITNPPAGLKEPFNFNRSNPDDFSLVELKTLRALGKDRFDFKPTVPRQRLVPARWTGEAKMKEEQLSRLKEHAIRNGLPIPEICVQ
ncbi:hypothetical protein FS837_011782 [Tulasnella sp. UAMH 9824]|nr:hypothetical protein FS837_011782 [Tulasnella sp. UAMH 9824]